jgi:hypothetical protein
MGTFQNKVLDRMTKIVRDARYDPVDDGPGWGGNGKLAAMDDDFNTIATASYHFHFKGKNQVQLARYPIVPGSGSVEVFNFDDQDAETIRAMLDRWVHFVRARIDGLV